MRKVKGSEKNVVALFSVETKNFIINGCRLEISESGKLIPRFPFSEEVFQGKTYYKPIIEFKDLDYLESIGQEARKAYDALR